MAKVKIYLDPIGNTMNIWWDDPNKAYLAEEVDSPYSNDVVIKDKTGKPISLEIIGLFPKELNISEKITRLFGIKRDEPFLLTAQRPQA